MAKTPAKQQPAVEDDGDKTLRAQHAHEERMEQIRHAHERDRDAAEMSMMLEFAKIIVPLVQAAGAGVVKMHEQSIASRERQFTTELKMAVEAQPYATDRLHLTAAAGGLFFPR